ncbi:MAG: chorismate synthase [Oscillospiraceae bacterium]|nr:chorismate synthase [Oscillospiraceae bacterium]
MGGKLRLSYIFGTKLKVSIFGQSHSAAIGVTVDGLPAGFAIEPDELRAFMGRRMPGRGAHMTRRRESDEPEFISGLVGNVTCGAPLTAIIRNEDARPHDYDRFRDVPRPSHADYAAYAKFMGANDIRGGGASSGRLTAPLCVAGGICLQLLRGEGIRVAAYIVRIGQVTGLSVDPADVGGDDLRYLSGADFPALDAESGARMLAAIEDAASRGDSVGGVIECVATGVPAGIGDPMFDGMENRLASVLFGIPAVKGVEFGNGFGAACLRGSENNDAFAMHGGAVRTRTNNHGGILGGITSGMPLIFRVAVKPTPSIDMEQDSVSLTRREGVRLRIGGRHDPCIAPRAVPCVEAAAAIAILDALLCRRGEVL